VQVHGLLVARNEVDIIRTNVLYHLSLGLDRLLVVDNGSSDGTDQVLRELGKDPRVRWTRDEGLFYHGHIATELAREAFREGADWVVPIDADEFWHAPGGNFRGVLEESEAGALRARLLNFFQRREQRESAPDALLYMTRRIREPVVTERGNRKLARELVESHKISKLEIELKKWVSRPTADIEIVFGNHKVERVAGLKRESHEIVCLHAPIRSRVRLDGKAEVGERSEETGSDPNQGWHVKRWRRLRDEGRLEQEWAANSYAGEFLDVYGVRRKTVFDPTLRDAVAPFLENGRHEEEGLEKRPLWRRITKKV
jgi:glycosyltransferase involved in cell wall biosynthesis